MRQCPETLNSRSGVQVLELKVPHTAELAGLNRIEHCIRCYDPCLSCSTHAIGQMPMIIDVVDPDGKVMQTLRRD